MKRTFQQINNKTDDINSSKFHPKNNKPNKSRMKKIYIILITIVFILSGCKDFLYLEPQDELIKEEYWKTEGDVVAVLGSTYSSMSNILDNIYYWAELRGGLIAPNENYVSTSTLEFYNFNINEYNSKLEWDDFYLIINLANTIIEFAPEAKANDQTFSEIAHNGYIAEAYYIRSLCYFYLVKTFKDVPFITQSYATDDQDFNVEKTEEQVIVNQLIEDLNGIVDQAFKEDYFELKEERKGRVNENAIYALLAEIYLWNNEYQKCIETCNKVQNVYLLNGVNYFALYAGSGNSQESIFELQFDYFADIRTTNNFASNKNLYTLTSNNSQGQKESLISEYLLGLYNLDDLRQYSDDGEITFSSYLLSLWKYEGNLPYDRQNSFALSSSRGRSDSDANWIFHRLSDMYLMKAEAYAELNDFSNALIELNTIKTRAGITEYLNPENKIKLLSEILDERAREFVGEGKRWYDLVRITRRDTENRLRFISEAVMSNVDPRSRSAVANKLKDENSWYLPIIFNELQLNNKLEQNPFYE